MKHILVSALLVAAAAARAAVPGDFRATRTLSGAALDAPRLAEVRLDSAILADTRPGFPDLRLFDAENREIPRAVEPLCTTKERTTRTLVLAKAADLFELSGNRIEARFDIEPGAPSPDVLEVRTPLENFVRTVHVSGSDDGQFWTPLVEADIFDYSRYMDHRRTEIALPKNAYRHFSLEISDATEERAQPLIRLVQANGQDRSRAIELLQTPFRIGGVYFWSETSAMVDDEPVLREWPHAGMRIEENPAARTTEIVLETRRAPVTRIDIETATRNFNRIATIQIPAFANGRKTWSTVADGIISRIDLPDLKSNRLSVAFSEQRAEQLRVVIQNADSPFLEVTAVRTWGPIMRLLWIAEPAAAYRLAYGGDDLAEPAYDLAAIRAAQENSIEPRLWNLAAPPAPAPAKSGGFGDFLARPAVFGALLALAALALLALLAKALKIAA